VKDRLKIERDYALTCYKLIRAIRCIKRDHNIQVQLVASEMCGTLLTLT